MANITATIPSGMTATTAAGLTQWDYGRKLEVTSTVLTKFEMVEVHFAYAGATTAIVHYGTVANGKLTVAIPDACLQQSSPIIAWVFVPTDDDGRTILTVTMPVTSRTRPADTVATPPESYTSKYTELITAVNSMIETACTRAEFEEVLGKYINDLDALIGGNN